MSSSSPCEGEDSSFWRGGWGRQDRFDVDEDGWGAQAAFLPVRSLTQMYMKQNEEPLSMPGLGVGSGSFLGVIRGDRI